MNYPTEDPNFDGRSERRGRGPRGERGGRRGERGPGGEHRSHTRHAGPEAGFGPDFGADFGPGPNFGFGPGAFPMPPHLGGPHHGGPGRRGRRAGRGDVRMAILHLLNEQPRNGYQMIQELAERTDGLWKPSPGAIYPALSALEDEGLVVPDPQNPKVFTLTDAGRTELERSPEAPWTSFQTAGRSFQASRHGALWKEFGKLAEALRAVATNAADDQLDEAAGILARTRRDLFVLLASDPVAPAPRGPEVDGPESDEPGFDEADADDLD